MQSLRNLWLTNKKTRYLIVVPLILGVVLLHSLTAYGFNHLTTREVKLSSNVIASTSQFDFNFSGVSLAQLGSIEFEFCRNDPLPDSCDAPIDFNASAATLVSQSGETGFSINSSASTSNAVVLSRTAQTATVQDVSYVLGNILNSTQVGTQFIRIYTFSSEDASGPSTDFGGLAYSLINEINLSATVPPFLLFCNGITITDFDCSTASGDSVNFGELSSSSPRAGSTQMVAATNADNGYGIWANGTTMISGNNVIPAISTSDVSRPGTSQFGINLRANSDPQIGSDVVGSGLAAVMPNYNTPNRYRFVPNEEIVSSNNEDDYRKYTVSYILNISKDQPAGIYVSTITYIAIANF